MIRTTVLGFLVGLSAGCLIGCAATTPRTLPQAPGLANVGCVDDGLWRTAQPTCEGYRSAARLGVRTVVNLRTTPSDRRGLARTGIDEVRIPCLPWNVSTCDLVAFLAVATDPARRPVLVHCAQGRDRTGACVAAYRVVVDGWTVDEALAEMRSYGANPIYGNLPRLLRRLDPAAMRACVAATRGVPVAAIGPRVGSPAPAAHTPFPGAVLPGTPVPGAPRGP